MTDTPIKLAARDPPARRGSAVYPEPFRAACRGRLKRVLGDAFGLSQFGVNHTVLEPGAASAQRHWHEAEDEFVYILSGQATLETDAGETPLGPGDCAGFPAGRADGHRLVNNGAEPVVYLEIGARASRERAHYPDIDLIGEKTAEGWRFTRKDGTAW